MLYKLSAYSKHKWKTKSPSDIEYAQPSDTQTTQPSDAMAIADDGTDFLIDVVFD